MSSNLLRSVQSAGLLHLDRVAALGASPADVEPIVSDRALERGGLELLRGLLAR
jgi:hypothetical protein